MKRASARPQPSPEKALLRDVYAIERMRATRRRFVKAIGKLDERIKIARGELSKRTAELTAAASTTTPASVDAELLALAQMEDHRPKRRARRARGK